MFHNLATLINALLLIYKALTNDLLTVNKVVSYNFINLIKYVISYKVVVNMREYQAHCQVISN